MVEIHDLHVRFHGASREAVAGIDLTIRDGEDQYDRKPIFQPE